MVGEGVHLRKIRPYDATETYLSWMTDEETTRYLEVGYRQHTLETLRHDIERFNSDPNAIFLAICLNDSHMHIGNIKLDKIDWVHRFGELGFVLDKRFWRQGLMTEAVNLMCERAFAVTGLRRVTAGYFDDNEGSRKVFWRTGFEIEGWLKEHRWSPHAGKWVDEIRVARTSPAPDDTPPRDRRVR